MHPSSKQVKMREFLYIGLFFGRNRLWGQRNDMNKSRMSFYTKERGPRHLWHAGAQGTLTLFRSKGTFRRAGMHFSKHSWAVAVQSCASPTPSLTSPELVWALPLTPDFRHEYVAEPEVGPRLWLGVPSFGPLVLSGGAQFEDPHLYKYSTSLPMRPALPTLLFGQASFSASLFVRPACLFDQPT